MGKGGGAREASGTHRAALGGGDQWKGLLLARDKKKPWYRIGKRKFGSGKWERISERAFYAENLKSQNPKHFNQHLTCPQRFGVLTFKCFGYLPEFLLKRTFVLYIRTALPL